jgi:D-citramalate synthase
LITWDQAGKTLRTRGVHANQVFAAINAALRMLNLVLHAKKALPAESS